MLSLAEPSIDDQELSMDWFAEDFFDMECSLKCFDELVCVCVSFPEWSELRLLRNWKTPAETIE